MPFLTFCVGLIHSGESSSYIVVINNTLGFVDTDGQEYNISVPVGNYNANTFLCTALN